MHESKTNVAILLDAMKGTVGIKEAIPTAKAIQATKATQIAKATKDANSHQPTVPVVVNLGTKSVPRSAAHGAKPARSVTL